MDNIKLIIWKQAESTHKNNGI